ncbi:dual specificity protein phosphatase family protein [candidate division WOR-3 bacterium]|nr:dual specificity protein phosphatase family protein [candidate division WOR-3 bacterium]
MIQLPQTNIFIGTRNDLAQTNEQDWAFVHATQTIHYKIFGWNRTTSKPNKKHPNYIFYEKDNRLSLNWVDGVASLYDWSGFETFNKILDFIEKWSNQRKILIHCDQGQSRAPTLGLQYLAKRLKSIPNGSYADAKNEFIKIYPNYSPSGIGDYVAQHWNEIN